MRSVLIAILATTSLTAFAANAPADGGAGPRPEHKRGELLTEMRDKFDTNHDGKLDETERAAMRAAISARMKENHPELFAKVDTDHDGQISEEEFKAFRETHGPGPQGEGKGPHGDGKGPHGDGKGPHGEGKGKGKGKPDAGGVQ